MYDKIRIFSYLPFLHCAINSENFQRDMKFFGNCAIMMNGLKSFKTRSYHTLSQTLQLDIQTHKLEEGNVKYRLDSSSGSSYNSENTNEWCSALEDKYNSSVTNKDRLSFHHKVYIIKQTKKEVKRMKRNGIYLYNCPSCEKVVLNFSNHVKEHGGMSANILYGCDNCNHECNSFDEMESHICRINHLTSPTEIFYRCEECPFKSKQKGNLKTHSMVHRECNEIPMYKCDQCKFKSRQKGNLKTHKLVHKPKEEIEMYKCDYCLFQARQKGNLQTHILRKHKNVSEVGLEKILSRNCKICSFKANKKKTLKQHMEIHNMSK